MAVRRRRRAAPTSGGRAGATLLQALPQGVPPPRVPLQPHGDAPRLHHVPPLRQGALDEEESARPPDQEVRCHGADAGRDGMGDQ